MYLFSTTFVDLPSASTMIASTSEWAQPFWDSFSIFLWLALALIVVVGLIMFVINIFRSILGG